MATPRRVVADQPLLRSGSFAASIMLACYVGVTVIFYGMLSPGS